jgi:hypothetical protein
MASKLPTRPIEPGGEFRRPRVKNHKHLDFIRSLPCVICHKAGISEAAHIRFSEIRHGKRAVGAGEKPDDRWVLPLCAEHHREQHSTSESLWWKTQGIDPHVVAALLYSHSAADDQRGALAVIQFATSF